MKAGVLILFAFGFAFAQKTADNPKKPHGSPYELAFEEELRFGGGDGEDIYLWPNDNSSVTADDRGYMYVSDIASKRVLEFDAAGTFVREIASEGEGPGEFRGQPFFQILADGSAMATDLVPMSMPRFYTFDKNLAYADSKMADMSGAIPGTAYFSPDGQRLMGTTFRMDMANGKLVLGVGVFDNDLKLLRQVSSYDMPMPDFSRMSDPAMWRDNLKYQLDYAFKGNGAIGFDEQGRIYIGDTKLYRVVRWDSELTEKELVITREHTPIPYQQADLDGMVDNVVNQILQSPMPELSSIFSEAFVKKVVDGLDIPPVKRPIYGLLVTDGGEILVIHDIRLGSTEQLVDVFSPDGRYLNQIRMTGHPFFNLFFGTPRMSFRNGKAYTMRVNEDGDMQVVRYKLHRKKS